MTPFGYFWGYAQLMNHNKIDEIGLQIQFPNTSENKDLKVFVKANPSYSDRFNWFLDGLGLNFQAIYLVLFHPELFNGKGNIATYYCAACVMFGFTQIAVAIFPKMNWNKKIY